MTQTKAKHLKESMCSEFAKIFELCQFVLVSTDSEFGFRFKLNMLSSYWHSDG